MYFQRLPVVFVNIVQNGQKKSRVLYENPVKQVLIVFCF